jgi:hypothetical protein
VVVVVAVAVTGIPGLAVVVAGPLEAVECVHTEYPTKSHQGWRSQLLLVLRLKVVQVQFPAGLMRWLVRLAICHRSAHLFSPEATAGPLAWQARLNQSVGYHPAQAFLSGPLAVLAGMVRPPPPETLLLAVTVGLFLEEPQEHQGQHPRLVSHQAAAGLQCLGLELMERMRLRLTLCLLPV